MTCSVAVVVKGWVGEVFVGGEDLVEAVAEDKEDADEAGDSHCLGIGMESRGKETVGVHQFGGGISSTLDLIPVGTVDRDDAAQGRER